MNAAQDSYKQTQPEVGAADPTGGRENKVSIALSALVDGELNAGEVGALFQSMEEVPGSRAAWHSYHVIGDVMRGSAPAVSVVSPQAFLAGVQARLHAEPAVKVHPDATSAVLHLRAPAANDADFRWKLVAGVASLAAVVAVSWSVLGGESLGGGVASPQLALSQPAAATSVANLANSAVLVNTEQGTLIRDARLEQLLAEHRQYGGMSALQMPAGFLRDATFDVAPQR